MGEENSRAYDMYFKQKRSKIYKSMAIKNPESLSYLCNYWYDEPAEPLDGRGNTLLHLLVICNNEDALKTLMDDEHVSQAHLNKKNIRGETALHEAARHDNESIVRLLIKKEIELSSMLYCSVPMCNCKDCAAAMLARKDNLVTSRNELGETALFLAAACGNWNTFKLILKYNNDDCMTQRNDGCTVLHAAIMGEYYRTASKILNENPRLAHINNRSGESALYLLASSPSSFRSNSYYTTATMGNASFIPLQILRVLFYMCIPYMYTVIHVSVKEGDEEGGYSRPTTYIEERPRHPFVELFLGLPWIQPIDDTKGKNLAAVALAKQLLEQEVDWSRYTYSAHNKEYDQSEMTCKAHFNPLLQAIEMGIPELVEEILHYFPDAANSIDKDGRNVFHYAAEHRHGEIYEKLKEYAINRDRMLLDVDNKGNTILHHATKNKPVATHSSLGLANLMAWDISWFERIRRDCYPQLVNIRNNNGSTPEDLLWKDYKNKREAAEKAVKEANQGLMVVAALIVTVSFTAVFTLPGGFNQSDGIPMLKQRKEHHRDLNLFLIYVGLTFFASLIALGTLLSTQLSRFYLEDLYFALPLKYSIAISCLFLSSCSIFTTFLQALVLEEIIPPYYVESLIIGCIIMGLVYVDCMYHLLSYLVEVLRYSWSYRSQKRW